MTWDVNEKKVYSKTLGKATDIKFLRPNFVNMYNFNMNSVDMADQLRINYEMGKNTRNHKWWWSIFFWGFDVALVNAYICYKNWLILHDKEPVSHHDFRLQVALAWLKDEQYWPGRFKINKRKRNSTTRSMSPQAKNWSPQSRTRSVSTANSSVTFSEADNEIEQPVCKLTDESLKSKSFQFRLICSNEHTHLPIMVKNANSECQLHRWALNKVSRNASRTKKHIAYCSDCKVKLCMICYKAFHTVQDLNTVKNELIGEVVDR